MTQVTAIAHHFAHQWPSKPLSRCPNLVLHSPNNFHNLHNFLLQYQSSIHSTTRASLVSLYTSYKTSSSITSAESKGFTSAKIISIIQSTTVAPNFQFLHLSFFLYLIFLYLNLWLELIKFLISSSSCSVKCTDKIPLPLK